MLLQTSPVGAGAAAGLPLGFDLVVVVCPPGLGRAFEAELARRAPALAGRIVVAPWAAPPPSGLIADGGGGLLAGLHAAAEALSAREGRGALSAEVFSSPRGAPRAVLVLDASASSSAHPALPAALVPCGADGRDGLDHALAAAARLWPRPPAGAALLAADEVLILAHEPGAAPEWVAAGSAMLTLVALEPTPASRAATAGLPGAPCARAALAAPQGGARPRLAAVARLLPGGAAGADAGAMPLASAALLSPALCASLVALLDAPPLHGACARGWDVGAAPVRLRLLADLAAAACRAPGGAGEAPGGWRERAGAALGAEASAEAAARRALAGAFGAAGGAGVVAAVCAGSLVRLAAASGAQLAAALCASAGGEGARAVAACCELAHTGAGPGGAGPGAALLFASLGEPRGWAVGGCALLCGVRAPAGAVRVADGGALWEAALRPAALPAAQRAQLPRARRGQARVRLLCGAAEQLDSRFEPQRDAAAGSGGGAATFCGVELGAWLAAKGLEPADLWGEGTEAEPGGGGVVRTLRTARLFPVWMAHAHAGTAAEGAEEGAEEGGEEEGEEGALVAALLRARGEGEAAAAFAPARAGAAAGASTAAGAGATAIGSPLDGALVSAQFGAWAQPGGAPPTAAQRAAWRSCVRVSFAGAAALVDVAAEGAWRRALGTRAALGALVSATSPGSRAPLGEAARACGAAGGGALSAAARLLDVRCERSCVAGLARLLAASAELLAASAGARAAPRSGSARSPDWAAAAAELAAGSEAAYRAGAADAPHLGAVAGAGAARTAERLRRALAALRTLRDRCVAVGSAAELVRAGRHLEAAAAAVVEGAVMAAPVSPQPAPQPPPGWSVLVRAPARADLCGGWSDTPPLCWEAAGGGAVLNVAIALGGVEGGLPLRARARRVPECAVVLWEEGSGQGSAQGSAVLTELAQLRACADPSEPFALLRAALLCCGALRADAAAPPLRLQLAALGGGIELSCGSALPRGSGLGASSILGAAAIAAAAGAFGLRLDGLCLAHAALQLEQRLSARGGWQDQVGGIFPGLKLATCAPSAPPALCVRVLPLSAQAAAALDAHLCVAFTGATRLARGLLEGVLRKWHAGSAPVVAALHELVGRAHEMGAALQGADMAAAGACLDRYWELKKTLCADAQPPAVGRMLAAVRPLVHGASLAGAGGGGFLLMLTREPHAERAVAAALGPEGGVVYPVRVMHGQGMVLSHEPPDEAG